MEIVISDLQEKLKGNNLLKSIEKFNEIFLPYFVELSLKEEEYSSAYNSAAYVALRYNLIDLVGNCYDAGATEIKITIPANKELIDDEKVVITFSDNGKGFPDHMLLETNTEEKSHGKKYTDILNGKIKIESNKKKDTQDPVEMAKHGGAGMGLARMSLFLQKKGGDIYLSKNDAGQGAKITIESQQSIGLDNHQRLAVTLGKIKDQQNQKIEQEARDNLPKVKVNLIIKDDVISSLEKLKDTFEKIDNITKADVIKSTINDIETLFEKEDLSHFQKVESMQNLLESLNKKISPQGGSAGGLNFFSNHKVVTSLIKLVKDESQLHFDKKEESENKSQSERSNNR
ncbi:MAG: sensor histidine kinase [Gammaproteobacteria bacterium]|nr:sensor histidine kinase [Gammaproteobacteria bacterium]